MAKAYLLDEDIKLIDELVNGLKDDGGPACISAVAKLLQAKSWLINTKLSVEMMKAHEDLEKLIEKEQS